MRNFITAAIIVILPIMAFADTMSEINKLMDRIKSNSKAYRVICYLDRRLTKGFSLGMFDIDNKEEYCLFLKEEIVKEIVKKICEDVKVNISIDTSV
jgi:hypothetical protein